MVYANVRFSYWVSKTVNDSNGCQRQFSFEKAPFFCFRLTDALHGAIITDKNGQTGKNEVGFARAHLLLDRRSTQWRSRKE